MIEERRNEKAIRTAQVETIPLRGELTIEDVAVKS